MPPRAAILGLLACTCPWLQAEIAMVNPLVPEATLSQQRTRDLLLGRITTWNDGSPVILVLIDDPAADAMLQQVVGWNRSRLIRGWKRLVYSGNGAMPLLASSLSEAADLVARHPGALALIARSAVDARCRYLPVTETPPR